MAAGNDFLEEGLERGAVLDVGALAEFLQVILFGIVAKDVLDARAGEGVAARGIERE